MKIKLFEEFSEWDRDDFLLDLFTMTSTEVENLFFEEIKKSKPHIEKIRVIIESGLVDLDDKDGSGHAPLHWVALMNRIEASKLLIEMGANLDVEDDDRCTPLHIASMFDYVMIAEMLIGAGADLEAEDKDKQTPLHHAMWCNRIRVAELLLKAGADAGAIDYKGWTPLDRVRSQEMKNMLDKYEIH